MQPTVSVINAGLSKIALGRPAPPAGDLPDSGAQAREPTTAVLLEHLLLALAVDTVLPCISRP